RPVVRGRARDSRGHHRRDGRGQDHAAQPAHALLRPQRGPDSARRRGSARLPAGRPARPVRHRPAGPGAVLGERRRAQPLRAAHPSRDPGSAGAADARPYGLPDHSPRKRAHDMRHAAATGAGPPRGGDAVAATSGRLSSRARAVLRGELACHPAVAAWRELVPDAPDPERIEVLRQGKKSTTYRLVESTPGGASIIAQRACMAKALIERTVYEDILPHLPVTSPRYYGCR